MCSEGGKNKKQNAKNCRFLPFIFLTGKVAAEPPTGGNATNAPTANKSC